MVITMPQLGETVTEGTIVRWHKAVGDEVVEDDILFEVSTDKVDSEVPSPAAGILREILVEEGETVAVGTTLAVVASADASVDELPAAPVPHSEVESEPPPAPSSLPINVSATQRPRAGRPRHSRRRGAPTCGSERTAAACGAGRRPGGCAGPSRRRRRG